MESKKRIIQIVTPATPVFAMYKNRDADGSDWRQPGQITLWALIEYKNGSRGVEGLLAEEYGIEEAEMYGDFAGYYNAEEVEDMISFTPAPDAPLKNKKPAMSVFQFPAPDVDQ